MADRESETVSAPKISNGRGATRHCCYGLCNSDSRYSYREYMAGVNWISFIKPKKKNLEKCQRWVRACGRENFTIERITRWTYICSKHFVGGNGPTTDHPDPIPSAHTPIQAESFSRKRKAPTPRGKPVTKQLLLEVSEAMLSLQNESQGPSSVFPPDIQPVKTPDPLIDTNFHTYARPSYPPNRTPSFLPIDLHSYCRTVTTPKKGMNKREHGTPTETTPKHAEKLMLLGSLCAWTEKEKECLLSFVDQHPPLGQSFSNQYWRDCARYINGILHSSRTGPSCRGIYKRLPARISNQVTADNDVLVVTPPCSEPLVQDKCCQTELSVPNRNDSPATSAVDCKSSEECENAALFLKNGEKMKNGFNSNCSNESYTNNLLNLLLTAGNIDNVASEILKNKQLKESLWNKFMLEISRGECQVFNRKEAKVT